MATDYHTGWFFQSSTSYFSIRFRDIPGTHNDDCKWEPSTIANGVLVSVPGSNIEICRDLPPTLDKQLSQAFYDFVNDSHQVLRDGWFREKHNDFPYLIHNGHTLYPCLLLNMNDRCASIDIVNNGDQKELIADMTFHWRLRGHGPRFYMGSSGRLEEWESDSGSDEGCASNQVAWCGSIAKVKQTAQCEAAEKIKQVREPGQGDRGPSPPPLCEAIPPVSYVLALLHQVDTNVESFKINCVRCKKPIRITREDQGGEYINYTCTHNFLPCEELYDATEYVVKATDQAKWKMSAKITYSVRYCPIV